MSRTRIINSSSLPPKYPEIIPYAVPTRKLTKAPQAPTIREIRAPSTTRDNMSRPLISVPKGWWAEGHSNCAAVVDSGSYLNQRGPSIAKYASIANRTSEPMAMGFLRRRRQAPGGAGATESLMQADAAVEPRVNEI